MAKDLPYFKFFCSEWNDGDITLEDYEIQGLFINICSYYWSNECYLSVEKLKKRFKHNIENIEYLIEINIIHEENDFILINFLDEQSTERKRKSKVNSENGSKGGRPKNPTKSENKPNALNSLSEIKGNKKREEERREEKKTEFENFWNFYNKKKDQKKCFEKWLKLSKEEIKQIKLTIKSYVDSTPDVQFRKNPLTYLNGKSWNDEITAVKTEKKSNEQIQYENIMKQVEKTKTS
jgi:hypothetical protein